MFTFVSQFTTTPESALNQVAPLSVVLSTPGSFPALAPAAIYIISGLNRLFTISRTVIPTIIVSQVVPEFVLLKRQPTEP